jgi:hypothetical protein
VAAEEDPVGEPGLVPNPFPGSKVGYPVYHGSRSKSVKKFRRPDNGVWFAGRQGWVDDLYTADGKGEVLTCWINVQNPYTPTEEENDWYYGDMDRISEEGFFKKLEEEGYDAYLQGGDSDSIAVFSKAEVVNALTGERM